MWRVGKSATSVCVYYDDVLVAECFTHEYAARIVAAMNAAEATERVIDLGREPRSPADVFRNPPSFASAEPARKAVCGTCGGSGETEEDATGALGYVVKKPCPDCAGGR